MQSRFLKTLEEKPIIFDGATGTMLQRLGLKPGGCPDELNITNPEMIKAVHQGYAEAGSDVVTTCTFGANRIKLQEYNLENKLRDLKSGAARYPRRVGCSRPRAAGGAGLAGKFLEPV